MKLIAENKLKTHFNVAGHLRSNPVNNAVTIQRKVEGDRYIIQINDEKREEINLESLPIIWRCNVSRES